MAQLKKFVANIIAEIDALITSGVKSGHDDQHLDVLLRYESKWSLRLLRLLLQKHAGTCDVIHMEAEPTLEMLYRLPLKSNAAYIRAGKKLFYVNIEQQMCDEVKVSVNNLIKLDEILKPQTISRVMDEDELEAVVDLANHAHYEEPEDLSEETLRPFIEFLQARFNIIKNTDAIYNHNQFSMANIACIALAKGIMEALGSRQTRKHYYEYLFAGLRCADYTTSKGDLGALKLHEFFFSDSGIPVETLLCIARYRENLQTDPDCYPPHVCKSKATLPGKGDWLTPVEVRRLTSHSKAANDYMKDIDSTKPRKTAEELDRSQKALEDLVAQDDFIPGYTYNHTPNKSNTNLLRNGFLDAIDAYDVGSLARLLYKNVKHRDWVKFVSAIDDEMFYHLMLPKTEEKMPAGTTVVRRERDNAMVLRKIDKSEVVLGVGEEGHDGQRKLYTPEMAEVVVRKGGAVSLLRPDYSTVTDLDKFKGYVNAQKYSGDRQSDENKAILFLITELYIRRRPQDGMHKTQLGSLFGAKDMYEKKDAAIKLREFFARKSYRKDNDKVDISKKAYMINQLSTFLEENDGDKYEDAVKDQRLGVLSKKARALGPGVNECVENLGELAKGFSIIDPNTWAEQIADIDTSVLKSYVDSAGNFTKCVQAQQYQENNIPYNNAILYILSEYYVRTRGGKDEFTGMTKGYTGYSKQDKVEACKIFRDSLCRGKPANEYVDYMRSFVRPGFDPVAIMQDLHFGFLATGTSETAVLLGQAGKVCSTDHYHPDNRSLFARYAGFGK